jgi:signal transduction histidine kinase
VQDDGAGIEPRYHGRIFGLFQTLKPRDEVEASGLGLAIIHKLLERLGGKIAVDSDPLLARGTTFTFDVPIRAVSTDHIKIAA